MTGTTAPIPTCWVITDGKVGMENQCVGLAEALGFVPVVKRVGLRPPWRQLAPAILRFGHRWSLSRHGDRIDPPYPQVLIASGRQSVPPSLALGQLSNGRTFRIQIQDPGISPKHFDVVVTPRHDRLQGPNVVLTEGALHRIHASTLASARQRFAHLGALPRPHVAVLMGGPNRAYGLEPAFADALARELLDFARAEEATLLVTTSRRTGPANEATIRRQMDAANVPVWTPSMEDNPYLGYLAWADAILVTSDSVNMVSEACATGKPVYVIHLPGGSAKFTRFHRTMMEHGFTRPFQGRLDDWSGLRLEDNKRAASAIMDLLRQRLGTTFPHPQTAKG